MADLHHPRFKKNKLIPLKYSWEEADERRSKGLCICCEEEETSLHYLKHNNLRLVIVEEDDDQLSRDDRVLEEEEISDIDAPTQDIESPICETNLQKRFLLEASQNAKTKSVAEHMKIDEISDSLQKDESQEANKSTMMTSTIPQSQVSFSFLEPSFRGKTNSRFILEKLQDACVRRSLCHSGFECFMEENDALQMFDTMSMREQKLQRRRKLSASPKTLKFKYKQRYPPHWLQALDSKEVKQIVNPRKEKATVVFVFKEGFMDVVNTRTSWGGYISSQSMKKISEISLHMLELLRAVKKAEEGLLHLKHDRLMQQDDLLLQGMNHDIGVKVRHLDPTNELEPVLVETTTALLKDIVTGNPKAMTYLYITWAFYFALVYPGSNLYSITQLFSVAHVHQAFHGGDEAIVSYYLSLSKQSVYPGDYTQKLPQNFGAEVADEVKTYPWTETVDWDTIFDMNATLVPEVTDNLSTKNFVKFDEPYNFPHLICKDLFVLVEEASVVYRDLLSWTKKIGELLELHCENRKAIFGVILLLIASWKFTLLMQEKLGKDWCFKYKSMRVMEHHTIESCGQDSLERGRFDTGKWIRRSELSCTC